MKYALNHPWKMDSLMLAYFSGLTQVSTTLTLQISGFVLLLLAFFLLYQVGIRVVTKTYHVLAYLWFVAPRAMEGRSHGCIGLCFDTSHTSTCITPAL